MMERLGRIQWRSAARGFGRAGCLALGLLTILPIVAFLVTQPPMALRILVIGAFALTFARPALGWLALVGLSPFGNLIGRLAGSPLWSPTEPLVLAFLGGWLLREAFRRPSPGGEPASLGTFAEVRVAALFALAVVASLIVQLVVLQVSTAFPLDFVRFAWRFLWHDYFASAQLLLWIPGAAMVLEAIGVFVATVLLAARNPGLAPKGAMTFAAMAAAAAAIDVGHIVHQTIAQGSPMTFRDALLLRAVYMFPDPNAAGSYFVMAMFVAGGLAIPARRTKPAWSVALVLIVAGLWLSGSRTAFVAAVAAGVCFAAAVLARGGLRSVRPFLLALVALVILSSAYLAANLYATDRIVWGAAEWRTEMAATAVRMFRAHPVLGVGAGRFYDLSYEYSTPQWRAIVPHENAHNNFLQVLAELGLVGLSLLVALLVLVFRSAYRQAGTPRSEGWRAGTAVGSLAFVATWIAGHPLLTPEVSLAFWTVLGLVAGSAAQNDSAHRDAGPVRLQRRAWAVVALLIAGLVPICAGHRLAQADLTRAGRGFSQWHRTPDGIRFRWMLRRAVLYVPATAGQVSLAVRSPGGAATVRVLLQGKPVAQIVVDGREWQDVRIVVPRDYPWASVPVTLLVRTFLPSADAHAGGAEAETRIQVALPRAVE